MRLHTHTDGTGGRAAVLVHGLTGDHTTWHATVPRLLARGYTVTAVDLRGHGLSPRGDWSEEEALADDLVETLAADADLAVGHSFGARVLALAVARLTPRRVVYLDPVFESAPGSDDLRRAALARIRAATADSVREAQPRWSGADVAAELAGYARLDPAVLTTSHRVRDLTPDRFAAPTLILVPEDGFAVDAERAARLRTAGATVRSLPDAGHWLHRDALAPVLDHFDAWSGK